MGEGGSGRESYPWTNCLYMLKRTSTLNKKRMLVEVQFFNCLLTDDVVLLKGERGPKGVE